MAAARLGEPEHGQRGPRRTRPADGMPIPVPTE